MVFAIKKLNISDEITICFTSGENEQLPMSVKFTAQTEKLFIVKSSIIIFIFTKSQ